MNETVKYQWSKELGKKALKAYYKTTVVPPSVLIVGGILMCILGFAAYFRLHQEVGLLAMFGGGLLLLVFLRIQIDIYRLTKDMARLVSDPSVVVTILDDSLTIASSKSTRTHEWKQMNRLRECDGFVLLFSGKLIVASLPDEALSDDQVVFMKSKIGLSNRRS